MKTARGVGGGGALFKYFCFKGVIIRGRRLIEGRLLFKQIRYTTFSHHDVTVPVNVLTRRIDHTEPEVYIRFQISRRVVLGLSPQPFADK